MKQPFRLLRDALWQLSLEPDEQRAVLSGVPTTDELALDLDNAVSSLQHAQEEAGVLLDAESLASLHRLMALLDAPPTDVLWKDQALDRHPSWAEARAEARKLPPLIPTTT